jgi:hypothetical protein
LNSVLSMTARNVSVSGSPPYDASKKGVTFFSVTSRGSTSNGNAAPSA